MRFFKGFLLSSLLILSVGSGLADPADKNSPRLLPTRLGDFRQVSTNNDLPSYNPGILSGVPDVVERANFTGKKGEKLVVELIRFRQDVEAYEFLSVSAANLRQKNPYLEIDSGYGTLWGTGGYLDEKETAFFKGRYFVRLQGTDRLDPVTRDDLISELSATLDKGDGDIPVLIQHLPNYVEAKKKAIYLHGSDLAGLGVQSGVLTAIDADSRRDSDAVRADYGPSKLVIIEFNTPQVAAETDRRTIARIQELWKLGQPAPTAYRRVGNYLVFVFDAPDEQTAKQLIDQVKYEQVVQWLGDNPNILREAEKRYVNTTLGVFIAVMKASGWALITCLGVGGLIGGLLFTYRRSQQKAVTAYSDAGGMVRLNLDELTPETNPGRLLRERN